jgi:hypothetical protein
VKSTRTVGQVSSWTLRTLNTDSRTVEDALSTDEVKILVQWPEVFEVRGAFLCRQNFY